VVDLEINIDEFVKARASQMGFFEDISESGWHSEKK
jgi:hypothetical protein